MQTEARPQVANAPLSYGAFEITVGTDFLVPDPQDVLEAIGDAGYAGTDLGPPGYLGEGDALRQRLAANRLDLVGGFVPVRPRHSISTPTAVSSILSPRWWTMPKWVSPM